MTPTPLFFAMPPPVSQGGQDSKKESDFMMGASCQQVYNSLSDLEGVRAGARAVTPAPFAKLHEVIYLVDKKSLWGA